MHARYRLDNIIGQGGMGTIYRAYDRLAQTWVALKHLILNEFDEAAALRTALAAEFRLLATLRHPHIVSVLDYGFMGQTSFFTMEFLAAARPITQTARALPLPAQLQLLLQLLQTLEYLRRHQVVHRDLKPANVLVLHDQLKVLDFGLAVFEGQTSTTAGSIFYMAPEVLNNQSATHATDLFAAGVIAYEILAGQRPFEAANLATLVQRICTHEPDYAPLAGPPALRPLIAQLLAKDPAARFATAGEALAAFNTAVNATQSAGFSLETPAVRTSFIQAAQFVGRETERTQLATALTQALTGQGSAWLLGGESGVGKSRLLEEIRVQALVQGAYVWQGQAISEGGPSAHIWRTILRWLLLVTTPTDLEASILKPFVPQLETLLARPVPEAAPLDAAQAQNRLCATVLTLVRRAATQQPLVLLLEDLHWADALSLSVLNWLHRAAPELRLLILATYRDDEQPKLPEQLPHMQPLRLRRLDLTQVTTLTSAILGLPTEQLQPLATFLYRETEGNAFFLVEVLRSLAEETGLLSQIAQMVLPTHLAVGGIQQAVQRRLQRVPAADMPSLQVAALMGRALDLPVLQQLAPQLALHSWLSRCAEAAVLEPVGAGWQFAHDKLRQGVLATLPQTERPPLHQALAEAIEHVYAPDLAPHLERLVYHYAHTPQVAKYCHYLEQAGQAAAAIYANAQAVQYFTQALALAADPAQRYRLLLARELIYDSQGTRAAQAQDLAELTQLAQTLANPNYQIEVLLRQSGYYSAIDDFGNAAQMAEQASGLAQAHHQVAAQALAQYHWGIVFLNQGQYALAEEHFTTARTLAQAIQAAPLEADVLRNLANTRRGQRRFAEAQTFALESLHLARRIADRRRENGALTVLAMVTRFQGNYQAGIQYHLQSLQLAREIGNRLWELVNLNNLGAVYEVHGLYAQAQGYVEQAIQVARDIHDRQVLAFSLINLGHVHRDRGAFAEAQAAYQQSVDLLRALNNWMDAGDALTGLGHALVAQGQPQTAVEFFQQAVGLQQHAEHLDLAAEAQAGLAWAWLTQGQLAPALAQVELVLQYLATGSVKNVEEPFLVYLICYRVLQAAADGRAPAVLMEAYTQLQAWAAQLDADMRQAFLENVPYHREIIAAVAQTETQRPALTSLYAPPALA